jgi:hypothetical protein
MLSYTERALRRGAISQPELLAELDRLGFTAIKPRSNALAEYRHPDAGGHLFTVWLKEFSYSRALERLRLELAAVRGSRGIV